MAMAGFIFSNLSVATGGPLYAGLDVQTGVVGLTLVADS